MMERMLLSVFCLAGLHIFSPGLPHQYHYIDECLNWTEAQTYCRQKYTDLATIEDTEDLNQLNNTVLSSGYNYEVWIGLYGNVDWRWSDGYRGNGTEYRNWGPNEPDDHFCVAVGKSGTGEYSWLARNCTFVYPVICNYGTQKNPKLVYIRADMSWSNAQRYCKGNYTDLVTVKNNKDDQQTICLLNKGITAWIGLFGSPGFYWSDSSNSTFRNWEEASNPIDSVGVTGLCGVASLQGSQKWNISHCGRRLPFVCYGAPTTPAPVRRQVFKLRIKPEDSSVNLNEIAIRAQILKKLQDKLKEKGVSGVTLKWREQPDGKVFHKETENSQKKFKRKTEF